MPSKKKHRSAPLVDPLPLSQINPTRYPLNAEEVCVGCILWLPAMTEKSTVKQFRMSDKILDPEGYHHPIVILGVDPSPEAGPTDDFKVRIAVVTTFQNLSLADYMAKRQSSCRSLAIINAPVPDDSPHLCLEKKKKLQKQSYVRLDRVWETSISTLRTYSLDYDSPAYRWRLDEKSYHRLMSILCLEAQEYPSTKSVKARRVRRSSRLETRAAKSQKIPSQPDSTSSVSSLSSPETQGQQEAYPSHPTHSKQDPTVPLPPAQAHKAEKSSWQTKYSNSIPLALLLLIPQSMRRRLARACSYCSTRRRKFVVRFISLLCLYGMRQLWHMYYKSVSVRR